MKHANLLTIVSASVAALAVPLMAQAHHSAGAFDMQHPVIGTGTVKSFRWGNPHTWLYLMVPNSSGGQDEWEIEGPGVMMLARHGWNEQTIRTGDKLHVMMAPRKDGGHGGTFMRITLADGRVLDTGRLGGS